MGNKKLVTQEDVMKLLDAVYEKAVDGIPVISRPINELANDYSSRYKDQDVAVKKMINYQVAKCTTSGFLTGLGGLITLPVTVPANISSVLYVQMRMIACTACMAGLDVSSDQVQTMIYACLAGVSMVEVAKNVGIKFGVKLTTNLVKKIPGAVLVKINQKVGFRFLTKFGTKGVINIGKTVPIIGGVISGGIDLVETKVIGNRAYKMFFKGDFDVKDKKDDKEVKVIDAEFVEEEDE